MRTPTFWSGGYSTPHFSDTLHYFWLKSLATITSFNVFSRNGNEIYIAQVVQVANNDFRFRIWLKMHHSAQTFSKLFVPPLFRWKSRLWFCTFVVLVSLMKESVSASVKAICCVSLQATSSRHQRQLTPCLLVVHRRRHIACRLSMNTRTWTLPWLQYLARWCLVLLHTSPLNTAPRPRQTV